ncbi:MAG TPA: hypothetical protein VNA25_25255, partial [Phycisphaerae bacterium]|nr:hypothetical protein [Phycisphaerae bacterium]
SGLHGPHAPARVMQGNELYADAMAVRAGGKTAVFATVDTGGHGYRREIPIRKAVAEKTGIDEKCVIVTSRHNHSQWAAALDEKNPQHVQARKVYNEKADQGMIDACVKAVGGLRRAEIAAGTATLTEPIGQNRRARFGHGGAMPGWGTGPIAVPGEKLAPQPGPDSTRIDFLAAREVGKTQPFAVLTSYATHVHLGATSTFNGEFPGGVRSAMAKRIPGVTVVYANSTGGDVDLHCVHPIPPGGWDARLRWYAESLELLGSRFADAVVGAMPKLRYFRPARIRHEYFSTEGQDERRTRLYIVNGVAMGDAAVVSIPAELFNELGLKIHAASPFKHLLLMGYNGSGRLGYVGTPLSYEQGGYEIARGPAPSPAEEQRMIDAKIENRTIGRARANTGMEIVEKVGQVLKRLA